MFNEANNVVVTAGITFDRLLEGNFLMSQRYVAKVARKAFEDI